MNPKFIKLLEKKKAQGKELSPVEVKAKSNVIEDLMSDMGEMGKDRLKSGMKKVTVASDSKQGLEKGLDKAKEVIEGKVGEMMPKAEDEEEMLGEAEESEEMEDEKEHLDIADLKAQIEELKKKLESLQA